MKRFNRFFALLTALTVLFAVMNVAVYAEDSFDMSLVFSPQTQLVVYVDGEWSAPLSDTYGYNESVSLTAPEIEGKNFSHWEAGGSVISYTNPLKLTVNANTTLYAVYASKAPTAKAVAGFTSITRSNDGNSIMLQAITSGGTAGFVYSTTVTGNNLMIGSSEATSVEAVQLTDSITAIPKSALDGNNCYSLQLTPDSDDTVYHVRTYVTVGGETTYGDVKDVKLSELQSGISMIANLEGFDPESGLDEILSGLTDGIKTVTYFANGGVGATLTQAFKGDSVALKSNTFTRDGYTFNGWSTEENGSVGYQDGETVETEGNLVFYAQWARRSSGGGGGGSSLATDTVTVEKADNGSVSVNPKNASKGSTVTITVTPDKGYKLDKLTVTDQNGKDIAVTEKDGKYTFTMPAGKVDVTPTFVKEGSEPTTPPTDPTTPPADNENPFIDVNEGDYFYDAVLWAAKEGVTSGTTPTTFSPNESCTRGQMVTFLWRAAGSPEPKTNVNPFTDVKTGDYFYKAVLWAYENGITKGTSDTEFSPNATVTRGQTVTFLYRLKGEKTNGENPFTDVKASDYYYDSVLWAYENDITSGTSDTTFSPNDNCLRGQIVTFLYRCK